MKVYFLGCAGWIPAQDQTSCFMVEHQDQLFLLDVGTGVSNLAHYPQVLDKYDTISVLLSHYHLDHIIGLIYLLPYIKKKQLHIYGPGVPCYDHSTQKILEYLLQPVFFSRALAHFCDSVQCFDYGGKDFLAEGVQIRVKTQNHSAPSFRLTLADKLIYATDTVFEASEWQENYQGMTLLHECWSVFPQDKSKHTSAKELLEGLPRNLLQSTYLIHKNPEWTHSDYSQLRYIVEATGTQIAHDGMVLQI